MVNLSNLHASLLHNLLLHTGVRLVWS